MTTVEELEDRLRRTYDFKDNAEALIFDAPNNQVSFRFETGLGWEFSRGFWVGPDPKGTLYYRKGIFNHGGKLKRDRETPAYFYVDQLWSRYKERYAHIKFFIPGSQTETLGEFVARDLYDVTGKPALLRVLTAGSWKYAQSVSGNASVNKKKNSTEIVITSMALNKKCVIKCGSSDKIYGEAIDDIIGRLTFRRLANAHRGTSVRWYRDLAVFHDGPNATDFSAFFNPNEDSPKNPLGSDEKEKRWTTAVWSAYP